MGDGKRSIPALRAIVAWGHGYYGNGPDASNDLDSTNNNVYQDTGLFFARLGHD